MELVNLSARGTEIQVHLNIIERSHVIKKWYEEKEKEKEKEKKSFFVNFSPDIVHNLINYLSGQPHSTGDIFSMIIEELKIDGHTIEDTVAALEKDALEEGMQSSTGESYFNMCFVKTSRHDIAKNLWYKMYDP